MSDEMRVLTVLRWEEPPPPMDRTTRVRCHWDLVALRRELAARPGEWAVVAAGEERDARRAALAVASTSWGRAGLAESSVRLVDDMYCAFARYLPGGAR